MSEGENEDERRDVEERERKTSEGYEKKLSAQEDNRGC